MFINNVNFKYKKNKLNQVHDIEPRKYRGYDIFSFLHGVPAPLVKKKLQNLCDKIDEEILHWGER